MKGVEGLPLKYLIIALVGTVSIAMAIQMVNSFQSTVVNTTSLINDQVTGDVVKSVLGDTYVSGFSKIAILDWIFSDGSLTAILSNIYSADLNITNITASYGGSSNVISYNKILTPGSSSTPLVFNLPSVAPGTKINIGLDIVIGSNGGGNDETGTLTGIAQ